MKKSTYTFYILSLIFVLSSFVFARAHDFVPQEKANLPSFSLYKNDSDEVNGLVIRWEIVLTSPITKEGLNDLLHDLYGQARDLGARGILIHLYQNREYAESESGQWIAMLSTTGPNIDKPETNYSDQQLNQLGKAPEIKHGMSEDKRRSIFTKIILAEDKADKKADEAYPQLFNPSPGMNRDEGLRLLAKHDELQQRLQEKNRNLLAKKLGISRQVLNDIEIEGVNKAWPLPKEKKRS